MFGVCEPDFSALGSTPGVEPPCPPVGVSTLPSTSRPPALCESTCSHSQLAWHCLYFSCSSFLLWVGSHPRPHPFWWFCFRAGPPWVTKAGFKSQPREIPPQPRALGHRCTAPALAMVQICISLVTNKAKPSSSYKNGVQARSL